MSVPRTAYRKEQKITTTATATHFHVGWNEPGYDVEEDLTFLDLSAAKDHLTAYFLSYVQCNSDRHDCRGGACSEDNCGYSEFIHQALTTIAALWACDDARWAALYEINCYWTYACDDVECSGEAYTMAFRAFLEGVNPEDFNP